MDQVHDLHLQLLPEIGFVHEIDQALSKSLMVEFLRLKIIIGDDLSRALRTWQTDTEVATDKFLRDLDATTQTSTTLPSKNAAVGVALRQFRAASQLRVALPLTQLDEACEEMETFIQSCLEELRSPQETKNLIGELSSRVTDHWGRVRELLRSKPLRHPEVAPLIMVGLAADRPIESNFFPGLLEGLLGSLGMAAPGEGNPPASSREGAGHAWSTAMCGAISRIERKEVEAPEAVGLPPNLDLRYKEGFLEKQRHLIPPVFSDHSSSLRWLRQCSGWQSPWWCQRHFLRPVAARCHPPPSARGRWARAAGIKIRRACSKHLTVHSASPGADQQGFQH